MITFGVFDIAGRDHWDGITPEILLLLALLRQQETELNLIQ